MAIVDDIENDLLSRIVANAAALAQSDCNLEDKNLGEGASEFENVRNYVVERTLVTPRGRAEDSSVEVPLLVAVNQTATGAEFRALPEGPDAAEIRSSRCLTARDIQTAVCLVLPGELTKHAVSEGTKSATKITRNTSTNASRARRAGLQFNIEAVAARGKKVAPGVLLTEGAAAYLAGALEYLCAELLELSGNAARDCKVNTIRPRHVFLAVANDEELRVMCDGAIFRQAGVFPDIHARLLLPRVRESTQSVEDDHSFDRVFAKMLRAAPDGFLIDPRDGCHKCLEDADGATDQLLSLPALDAACTKCSFSRRHDAIEALSESQREAFDAGATFDRYSDEPSRPCSAVEAEHLRSSHALRVEAIRSAQRSVAPLFGTAAFARLAAEICQHFRTSLRFSVEALSALQTASEGFLIKLYKTANLNSIHAHRKVVRAEDLRLARRTMRDTRC